MKIKLGLVDCDRIYLERFAEYTGKKYSSQIEIYSFTEPEPAIRQVREKRIDVLIVSQDVECSDTEHITDCCAFAYFTETDEIDTYNGQRALCRYRRADDIYREILGMYSEHIADRVKYRASTDRARISLFVPECEGSGTSTLAAAFSEYLALKEKKTLFLNLRQLGDTDRLFQASGDGTFTDVIFAVKSRKVNVRLKLQSLVKKSRNGVFFFKSCISPLDCAELSADEIRILLDETAESGYDNIVVVSDMYVSERLSLLLEYADDVVIVSGNSRISEKRLRQKHEALSEIMKRNRTAFPAEIKVFFNKSDGAVQTGIPYAGVYGTDDSDDERTVMDGMLSSGVLDGLYGGEAVNQ